MRSKIWLLLLLGVLIVLFVGYRWQMRIEPRNSDDMTLFQISAAATAGKHWLFGEQLDPKSNRHRPLRIGMLALSLPTIRLLGPSALSFYIVPLLFGLLGFAVTVAIMCRAISWPFGVAFALVHITLPFELYHCSVFFVDLPAAATCLCCLALIGAAADAGSTRVRCALAVFAGLFAVWSYLLRTNTLVLAAPALLFLVVHRRTRWVAIGALGIVAAGVVAEQWLYISRDLGWGYRWEVVRGALDRYAPFLPVHPLHIFLIREFGFVWVRFGASICGTYALAFYGAALAAQVLMIIRSRKPVLRAIGLFGMTTWVIFAFAIYELTEEGIRAMAPVNFRYFQPFFYASVIALCWLVATSYARLRRVARDGASGDRPIGLARATARAVPIVVVATVAMNALVSARYIRNQLNAANGALRTAVEAIDQQARLCGSSGCEIEGPGISTRVIALFRGDWSEPPVRWRRRSLSDLARRAKAGEPRLIFLDEWRALQSLRYYKGEERRRMDNAWSTLQQALEERYDRMPTSRRYRIHVLRE